MSTTVTLGTVRIDSAICDDPAIAAIDPQTAVAPLYLIQEREQAALLAMLRRELPEGLADAASGAAFRRGADGAKEWDLNCEVVP